MEPTRPPMPVRRLLTASITIALTAPILAGCLEAADDSEYSLHVRNLCDVPIRAAFGWNSDGPSPMDPTAHEVVEVGEIVELGLHVGPKTPKWIYVSLIDATDLQGTVSFERALDYSADGVDPHPTESYGEYVFEVSGENCPT